MTKQKKKIGKKLYIIINLMAEDFYLKTLMYSDMEPKEIIDYFERKVENGN